MKILLIGEYSGVHNNLKAGLKKLGHEVFLFGESDGYKNFSVDKKITPDHSGIIAKIKNIFSVYNFAKNNKFEIVQIINPFVLPMHLFFSLAIFRLIAKNGKVIYYCCGTDPAFLAAENKFRYFPFDKEGASDIPCYTSIHHFYYKLFMLFIDRLITSSYTYTMGYQSHPKFLKIIPLPAFPEELERKLSKNDKIRILYGVTRPGMKGNKYIMEALNYIIEHKSDVFEVVIVDKIPFQKFGALLHEFDIYIDQCKSYDYGMAAIVAMQNGLIVMSGANELAINSVFGSGCPVFHIEPSAEQIIDKLNYLSGLNADEMLKIKKQGVAWVNTNHEQSLIAKKFVSQYELK